MAAENNSDTEAKATSQKDKASSWKKTVFENVKLVAIALTIAIFVRLFIDEPRIIPSPSMVPTLAVGARLLDETVS